MARSSGGDALLKKNSKLETFLKKALPERTVDRIRGYESCIVVSEQENKAFKYVVLGDEWIYLTENPPSKIQQSVWLGDVISVDLVNDFPEFLSGEERENSQHLAVRFLTAISRRRSLRKSRRPTNGSLHETDRSNASTPQGSLLEDFGYATQSTSSLYAGGSRPNSQNSLKDKITSGLSLSKKVKKPGSVSQESSEDHVKGGREAIEEERLEDIEECDLFDRSYDSSFTNRKNDPLNSSRLESKSETGERFLKKSASSTSNGKTRPPPQCPEIVTTQPTTGTSPNGWPCENKFGVEEPGCCLQSLCKSRSESRPATFVSSAKSRIRQNSIGPVTACELELGMSRDDLTNRDDVSEIIEVPNIKSLTTPRNSADIGGRGTLSPRTPAPSSRMSTPFLRSVSGTPLGDLSQDNRSLLMVPDSVSMNGEVFGDKRVAVLNIYLLTLSSPMLMLMRSACNNFMIRATLMLDPEFEKNYKAGAVRATYNHLEKMDVLFGQLKRELFRPGNTLADIYDLTNELKIAAERNFALKKIFWKNSDMFPYFVQLIQSYLPTSRTNLNTVAGRKQRHDEIELVILLTEIISIMFRETELIPARFQALKAQRGKAVLDLLRVLTCTPEIPEKQVAPSGRAAELIQSFQDEGYSSAAASEVTRLLSDFTEVSLTTVFELFLMAKQANWNQTSDNFLNIFWMVQVLEELSTTERYVERVIRQTMSLISPSRVDPLTPQEAVTLYQQFSVILVFLTYSPRVTFFIRNNYTEEFKYFVQPAAIERKLSPSYPITRVTLRLIEDVLSQVLEMPGSSLSVTPR